MQALGPLLGIAKGMDALEFQAGVQPTIMHLFASSDRGLRASLLQHMPTIVANICPNTLQDAIYPQVAPDRGWC